MRYLAVKNFGDFQHYKQRTPPWIKLYNRLLDDYAFLSLSDATRSHLMLIWLVASRHENRIPYDAAYIARAIHTRGKVDLASLIAAGFLYVVEESASDELAARERDASMPLAGRKRRAIVEGEREGEREGETETSLSAVAAAPAEDDPAVVVAPAPLPAGDVDRVLAHYRERHPHARPFTARNRELVRRRLRDGYGAADLCEAIDGNADDDWHIAAAKHELGYVLRSTDTVDKFRGLYRRQHVRVVNDDGELTAEGVRLLRSGT